MTQVRRTPLIFASLALFCLAMLAMAPAALAQGAGPHQDSMGPNPIVGTWKVVSPPSDGMPEVDAIKTFHSGGTLSVIDNAAPPSAETITLGSWKVLDDGSIEEVCEQYLFDSSGSFTGIMAVVGINTIDSLGNLNGTASFTIFDPNRNVLATGTFTETGTRLTPSNL